MSGGGHPYTTGSTTEPTTGPTSPSGVSGANAPESDRLDAVRAVVARYRKVSPSASQQMYVRDVEIALGLDLPSVTDRDGRSDW